MIRIAIVLACLTGTAVAQPDAGQPVPEAPEEVPPDRGQSPGPDRGQSPGPEPEEPEPDEPEPEPEPDDAAMQDLRDELDLLREDLDALTTELDGLKALKSRLTGYLDLGFFAVTGDGSGLRTDTGNALYPEYAYAGPWVFLGDPLSTAINSRGDPATTGDSRAITLDPIGTAGPTFLVNALSLQLYAGLGDDLAVTAFVDFLPRGRDVADPSGLFLGDYLDVKLAYVEHQRALGEHGDVRLQAGKFDSVVGYEYRVQEAPDRITVTPSLICRYLCGHPIGLKARARFLDHALIVNAAITAGSHFSEGFDFSDEIDRNGVPTGAVRLSYAPIDGLEIGASGALGPQDAQPDESILQWHLGADARLVWRDLQLVAEYVQGKAPGQSSGVAGEPACDEAPCLDYKGAYGLVSYRVSNVYTPYARVDWRDALHLDGASFVYISQLWRATAGIRMEFGEHVILKAEYTVNRELGRAPQFDDDVLASSLVVKY